MTYQMVMRSARVAESCPLTKIAAVGLLRLHSADNGTVS